MKKHDAAQANTPVTHIWDGDGASNRSPGHYNLTSEHQIWAVNVPRGQRRNYNRYLVMLQINPYYSVAFQSAGFSLGPVSWSSSHLFSMDLVESRTDVVFSPLYSSVLWLWWLASGMLAEFVWSVWNTVDLFSTFRPGCYGNVLGSKASWCL